MVWISLEVSWLARAKVLLAPGARTPARTRLGFACVCRMDHEVGIRKENPILTRLRVFPRRGQYDMVAQGMDPVLYLELRALGLG